MPPKRWRLRADLLTGLGLAVAAGILAFSTQIILQSREDAWARAREEAGNIVVALRQKIAQTIESLDLSLQAVVGGQQVPGVADLDPALRHLVLFDRSARARGLGAIRLLDATGNVVLDSRSVEPPRANYANRDFFLEQRDNPGLGLYIGLPYQDRTEGGFCLPISRRITEADGRFAGVVFGTIHLDSLRELFASLEIGPKSSVTLFREDGIVVMRVPYRAAYIGSDISGGTAYRLAMTSEGRPYIATAVLDGVDRLFTVGRVEGTPLLINLAFAVEDINAEWRPRGVRIALATLLLSCGLAATTLLLRYEISRRYRAEVTARENEAEFRLLAESSSDMVSRVSPDGVRTYVSPAARRILGRAPESMIGTRPLDEIHPDDREMVAAGVARLRRGECDSVTLTFRARHASGEWIWLESTISIVRHPGTGKLDGFVVVSRDVTERRRLEAELARLASLDGLTGLANRRSFDAALAREWKRCAQARLPLSVVLLDVDHFKSFNDHYGHQAGDECLRRVAAVVREAVRSNTDLAARYGGEEFVILLPEADEEGVEAVAERLRQEIEALAIPHGASAAAGPFVTASLGAATAWPAEGGDPAALLREADKALYEAKRAGRNRVAVALPSFGAAAARG